MKKIFVGTIPDIFGYGMSVVAFTKKECKEALKLKYADWKKQQPNEETSFTTAFNDWGGYIRPIEIGKVYFDNFGE